MNLSCQLKFRYNIVIDPLIVVAQVSRTVIKRRVEIFRSSCFRLSSTVVPTSSRGNENGRRQRRDRKRQNTRATCQDEIGRCSFVSLQAPLSARRERTLPVVHLCARQYAFEPVAPGCRGRGERPTTLKRARRCDTMRLALLLLLQPT